MRGRRLPLDIQIFYCARPDQEPFVKVGGHVSRAREPGCLLGSRLSVMGMRLEFLLVREY